MTIGVTGGSGFIGRHLLRSLGNGSRPIALLARNPAAARLGSRDASVEIRAWDADDDTASADAFRGIDVVIHAAAFVPSNMRDAAEAGGCFRVNALGTLRLVRDAIDAGAQHVVLLSSGQAYANLGRPACESDPLFPAVHGTYYLVSKLAGEVFAQREALDADIALTVLRLGAVYGPGMSERHVVARFCAQALRGDSLMVDAPGTHTADFVHVDDVVHAIVQAVEVLRPDTYNIGSERAVSILELARLAAAAAGRDPTSVELRGPANSPHRAGFVALDCARARGALSFAPRPLSAGLEDVMRSLALGDRAP